MVGPAQTIRVVVRLPYNRPEDPLSDPPRVEWNSEKERVLWDVIAKSRAIEGAATDWKGLAAHLQVPLPYLLHRAQTRYEEDLRGLQGIRGALSPASANPTSTFPLSAVPHPTNEYFPRLPDHQRLASSTPTRPLGVRARLSSLGTQRLSSSPHGPASAGILQRAKKVSSSSTITLQGPRRRTPPRPLSPASSREGSDSGSAGSANRAGGSSSADSSSDSEEESARREEEEGRRTVLEHKLAELQRALTKDALGLVAAPAPFPLPRTTASAASLRRGRPHPLSVSSASIDSAARSHSQSHQSLSSASSPRGSIPSIPSPPLQTRTPARHLARALSPQGNLKSVSPPALSPRSALGQAHARMARAGSAQAGRASEQGSEASSFSDLSDASLSASALESSLMSNIRGGGLRFSSFARSNFTGRRNSAR
ncbi:hypothetical protein B0H21DRAFT_740034 [Amylocystis lapponica]|nr:hypothetical protein B0H21DRAFT_740034 [Amylocystis lapponica]